MGNEKSSKKSYIFEVTRNFDTVNHKHLLNVFLDLGFRGPVQEIMSSYLSNRSQRVKIGNQLSSWKTNEIGVPHGSIP